MALNWSGKNCLVMNQNATAEIRPETITPLYSAFMILPPSLVDTKKVPMMEATMEAAPSTSGYSTALAPALAMTRPPSSIVATSVTA